MSESQHSIGPTDIQHVVPPSPLNDADPDIIIMSSDEAEFRLDRKVLSKATKAFEDIATASTAELRDGLPVIHLPEIGRTLDIMFRLLYPVDKVLLSSIRDVRHVLAALDKYHIETLPQTKKDLLLKAAKTDPEVIFALACRYRLPDIAAAAAALSLLAPKALEPVSSADLEYISGRQYQGLVLYQRQCITAAVGVTKSLTWIHGYEIPGAIHPNNTQLKVHPKGCRMADKETAGTHSAASDPTYRVLLWCIEYLDACAAALEKRPNGETVADPVLYLPSLQKAWACETCGEKAAKQMPAFSGALARKIDEVIQQVPLDGVI